MDDPMSLAPDGKIPVPSTAELGSELRRIRSVYLSRDASSDAQRYTPFDPSHHLLHFSRQRAFLTMLARRGIKSLQGMRILDVGCGAGGILLEYLDYGADPGRLHGTDLLADRLGKARLKCPGLRLSAADARALPFPTDSFDLVTQYTVFSSILGEEDRRLVASEMLRVLRPGGLILFYDFGYDNPGNPHVRGVSRRSLRGLFPGCSIDTESIVLAPPLSRRLARLSLTACMVLEALPFLCTHYMAAVAPQPPKGREVTSPQPEQAGVAERERDIRPMRAADVDAVVRVHLAAFPGFFLSFLGARFLSLMYRELQNQIDGVVLVACSTGRIVGFAAGVTRQRSFYRHLLLRHGLLFAIASGPALLRSPTIISRLLRALQQPEYVRQASSESCLMSLALLPELHGSGIATRLVDEFCEELFRRGCSSVSLTTDRDQNDRVNAFYRKMRLQVARDYTTPEGRRVYEYYKRLP
jgi:ubiquinone/menaquinone biosynthesis C-methylase UbiE/ribosomal protein S18 acetylase RimI-like enzyme